MSEFGKVIDFPVDNAPQIVRFVVFLHFGQRDQFWAAHFLQFSCFLSDTNENLHRDLWKKCAQPTTVSDLPELLNINKLVPSTLDTDGHTKCH